jgi:hypothetical protein
MMIHHLWFLPTRNIANAEVGLRVAQKRTAELEGVAAENNGPAEDAGLTSNAGP